MAAGSLRNMEPTLSHLIFQSGCFMLHVLPGLYINRARLVNE